MSRIEGKNLYRIIDKKALNPTVTMMEIEAPLVARKAQAGQFIILRVDTEGERIPLTIAGYDPIRGTVRIIFQIVGATTQKLNHKNKDEYIADFVGPLGRPTKLDGLKKSALSAAASVVQSRCRLRRHYMRAAVKSIPSSDSGTGIF